MKNDSRKPGRPTMKSIRRREELRRSIPRPKVGLRSYILRREFVLTVCMFALHLVLCGWLVFLAQHQPNLAVGQIMTESRFVRVSFEVENIAATESERQRARDLAPRAYALNREYLAQLDKTLRSLPEMVHGLSSAEEEIAERIRTRFALDDARLALLQPFASAGEDIDEAQATDQWLTWVETLVFRRLPANPTITTDDHQIELGEQLTRPFFFTAEGRVSYESFQPLRAESVQENRARWLPVVIEAGFPRDIAPSIAAALAYHPEPIFRFDEERTRLLADQAAASVRPVKARHDRGSAIFLPGEALSADQYALALEEHERWKAQTAWLDRITRVLGIWGVVAIISALMAGYLIRFYPRVTRNWLRTGAIAAGSAAMLAATVFVATNGPAFSYLAAVGTSLFIAMILVISYDQRLAATFAALQCVVVVFALQLSLPFLLFLIATCAVAALCLREVRHRNTLIQGSAVAAGIAVIGAAMVGILETPMVDLHTGEVIAGAWRQIWANAGLAGLGALGTGFVLLGILPSVERMFDLTTGLTLMELRDPRQPLLRQLQERAPGTYNHSLQVATVAEAAAEAIGADSLLTYVGGLYHDIGKMNKPAYFVENQSGGPSKHAKLSPAMSLLVIVGHVKDGVELAREYNLPRSIIHFIESHHGTTLVEYFYHAARERAEIGGGDGDRVEEIEFRYPGPRPRTREAAIMMLADASESATRAMEQPTHKSIENLVRRLSRKRLEDGQFNQCDLTLRELTLIEDAIIKTIWSIYHGRIAYPAAEDEEALVSGELTVPPAAGGDPSTRADFGEAKTSA